MTKEQLIQELSDKGFKRIADAISLMWGHPECEQYFNRLIIDDRGNRAGFPSDVMRLILKLHHLHSSEFSRDTPDDPWISQHFK